MLRLKISRTLVFWTLVALAPLAAQAQSNGMLDRVRQRAAERVGTQTEGKANEKVDSAVDETVDCVFNPIECAKQKSATTPTPGPAPAPAPGGPAAPPAADATEWYAERDGQRVGPLPRTELATMVTSGQVTAQTLVWREGMGEWTPAGSVPELGEDFKKVPPPLPPRRSGPPPLPGR
jgi:hypothetical protein